MTGDPGSPAQFAQEGPARVGPAVVWDGGCARLRVWVPAGDDAASTVALYPLSLAQLVALNHDVARAIQHETCRARRAGRLIDPLHGDSE